MPIFKFPDSKRFAFTIIDDTDDAFLENIKPIYDLLFENKILITKTIWVYPPNDTEQSKGDCLMRPEYLQFVKDIKDKGFEIGLHNVGSGTFERDKIIEGLNFFKSALGNYPTIHVNHSYNRDNIYSGRNRFGFPIKQLLKFFYPKYDHFQGDNPNSRYFWGDYHKSLIKFGRNYEIDDINTIKVNPFIPYKDKAYDKYANYWFSSTFASNQWVFNKKINIESIDILEKEGGICILYTHLGYYFKKGKIDPGFVKIIEYLGEKNTGWYVPISTILEFLIEHKKNNNIPEYIPFFEKSRIEIHSLLTRIRYRYFNKIDDFHFKKSKDYE